MFISDQSQRRLICRKTYFVFVLYFSSLLFCFFFLQQNVVVYVFFFSFINCAVLFTHFSRVVRLFDIFMFDSSDERKTKTRKQLNQILFHKFFVLLLKRRENIIANYKIWTVYTLHLDNKCWWEMMWPITLYYVPALKKSITIGRAKKNSKRTHTICVYAVSISWCLKTKSNDCVCARRARETKHSNSSDRD